MALESINPATDQPIQSYPEMSSSEVSAIIADASVAFERWRVVPHDVRAATMLRAETGLRARRSELARLATQEMGKPLEQSYAEVDKCASVCSYYARNGERFLRSEVVQTDASRSYIHYSPLGVILGVMPWNFPYWQVFRFIVPTLMAGNAALLKHASNVTGCALAIEDVMNEAGLPAGLFRALRLQVPDVGALVEHPLIRAVTLTGSTSAGRAIASRAGRGLKKTVLELGGSDPYLILEDAPLEETVEICVQSRLINSGQSCIAAKRFIVIERVLAEVERLFVEKMAAKTMGDPLTASVDLGPQARRDLRDGLHDQVERSVNQGARVLLGGKVPDRPGAFYPPTVLTHVRKGQPAYDDELFGPVAAIIAVPNEEEAVRVANDSSFGLGAAVFTSDTERGERIAAQQLEAGNCFVNAFVRSDARLPFGGIKDSGYGRELSVLGMREFVNIKTVYVA